MDPTKAVKYLIDRMGWTEQRIADAVGLSQPTINRIKNGARTAYDNGAAIVRLVDKARAQTDQH